MYVFGPFVLDLGEFRLTRAGEPVALPPKPFDLLAALVTRAGRLVTREELLKAVWKDVAVEQSSLNAAMSVLRQALGEDAVALIETVPGRGYRFIAPVEARPGQGSTAPGSTVAHEAAAPAARVVVVDDHAVVRLGVRALLERDGRCAVVAEAATTAEAAREIGAHQPDFLVLDLMLNDDSTLPHIAAWRAAVPGMRVIVLSMHEEDTWARQALEAGAHGYITKGAMAAELSAAMDAVLAGELWVSAKVSRSMLQDLLERRPRSG
ncbi:MAG: response regulator [Acidobacteriota bacterium]